MQISLQKTLTLNQILFELNQLLHLWRAFTKLILLSPPASTKSPLIEEKYNIITTAKIGASMKTNTVNFKENAFTHKNTLYYEIITKFLLLNTISGK